MLSWPCRPDAILNGKEAEDGSIPSRRCCPPCPEAP